MTGPGAETDRPGTADPVCALEFVDGTVVASLTVDRHTTTVGLPASADRIRRLLDEHTTRLDDSGSGPTPPVADPGPYLWSSPTEELLDATYRLISAPLVELLAQHGRVRIRCGSRLLSRLPIEAAHHEYGPALIDVVATYRYRPGPSRASARGRRRFKLTTAPSDPGGLAAVPIEHLIAAAVHRGSPGCHRGSLEPLVHLAGHRPDAGDLSLRPDGAAHLVLSGCSSLVRCLPTGVGSATCSLWPVRDDETSTLMGVFHARLALGVGPAEALRQSQLLHRNLPGWSWAAFVHVGDPV